MLHAPSIFRAASSICAAALAALLVSAAPAQTIDMKLNVLFDDPEDLNSGGAWQLVARSSSGTFGIAGLSIRLKEILSGAPANGGPLNVAPRGTVNGSDDAGFSEFNNSPLAPGRNISIVQIPVFPSEFEEGDEQSIFYGVGTIANGDPGDVGPAFTSLTNQQNIPWASSTSMVTGDAFGDPAWSTAAVFVSGEFAPGDTPDFFAGSSGNVFTSLPADSTGVGTIAAAMVMTTRRTNATASAVPDYNDNGIVDAADYVLWRKGSIVADGDNSGTVDVADYQLWFDNFGMTGGAGASLGAIGNTVPEPASGALLALGALLVRPRRGRYF